MPLLAYSLIEFLRLTGNARVTPTLLLCARSSFRNLFQPHRVGRLDPVPNPIYRIHGAAPLRVVWWLVALLLRHTKSRFVNFQLLTPA